MEKKILKEVLGALLGEESLSEVRAYGNGHINDTFLVRSKGKQGQEKKQILQKINTAIFQKPEELMENVVQVTAYLEKKIQEEGGDPERETLHFQTFSNGKPYYVDQNGGWWRSSILVERTICCEKAETPEDFYKSARAFGHFQKMLAEYPADTLHETIPDFHNTPVRVKHCQEAVQADLCGRAEKVREEIAFFEERKEQGKVLMELWKKGELPTRVTHNDTKLNNVLLDVDTKEGICVIDLDTVMPGLSAFDFGDSIRFGACTGAEDETDLSCISCDLDLFGRYVEGFLLECGDSLTEKEIQVLPLGAWMMAYEQGVRFLTDYLEGDRYYKIQRERQNLDRCRTQFCLVKDMERKMEQMQKIVYSVCSNTDLSRALF